MSDDALFQYTAVDRAGRQVRDVLRAADARAAARALAADGFVLLSIKQQVARAQQSGDRALKFTERVAVLRQLALMVEAGVGLLEAVQTVAAGLTASKGRAEFEAVSTALKRGEPFAQAMEANTADFPFYVHAMSRVGEATGRLGEVLRDAAEQMAYEDRLRRDFVNAMTYPGFLASAGLAAVFFIFTQVVPRFGAMVGDKRDKMPFVSRAVLDIGTWANAHLVIVLSVIGGVVLAGVLAWSNERARRAIYDFGHGVPLIGELLKSREISAWARLMAFALANGVGLLEAAALARQAAPEGAFRRGLEQFERDLKGGMAVDESLGRHTKLTTLDLSLLRAGQKSGALARMFGFMAEGYDSRLKDLLKRLTALVEPISIGMISIVVGIVALSLILALSSVYDSVF